MRKNAAAFAQYALLAELDALQLAELPRPGMVAPNGKAVNTNAEQQIRRGQLPSA